MQKLLQMEDLTGNEYYLPIGATTIDNFIENAPEVGPVFQYLQDEFPEYGPNQCTIYGPMTALSCVIGRELTRDERYEIATLGTQRSDWNYNMGANVSTGVDVVRSWWNRKNPNDTVVTFMLVNKSPVRKILLSKKFSYVSGFYGNQEYNVDASDGKLEGNSFGAPTYGHCTAELLSTVLDNYNNKYDRLDYNGCVRNKVLHNTGFVMFKANSLTDNNKRRLNAMKKGIWNGSDPDKVATRYEAVTMVARGVLVDSNKLWNETLPNDKITLKELNILCQRAGVNPPKNTKRGSIAEIFG